MKKDRKEYFREYSRKKRLNPVYREKERNYYREWYKRNGRNRSSDYAEAIKEWRQNHPKEEKAHQLLQVAVENGTIKKPKSCSVCGRITRLSGHHTDYSFPLKVIWVCSSCHKLIHVDKK